jgi:PLP dependent protein
LETIRDRYLKVNENIETACIRSHRSPEDVKLVVVVKRQPVSRIIEVLEAGASLLGENYPEEILERKQSLAGFPNLEWHMIGHIQSRKIKFLEQFSIIHSIDSIELLDRISRASGKNVTGLLEVNVSGETTKQGFELGEDSSIELFSRFLSSIILSSHVRIIGLMCMPPLFTNPERNRAYFIMCRRILEKIQEFTGRPEIRELSMGTSHDYEVAVEEGATFVRVGEGIMGLRPLKIRE